MFPQLWSCRPTYLHTAAGPVRRVTVAVEDNLTWCVMVYVDAPSSGRAPAMFSVETRVPPAVAVNGDPQALWSTLGDAVACSCSKGWGVDLRKCAGMARQLATQPCPEVAVPALAALRAAALERAAAVLVGK